MAGCRDDREGTWYTALWSQSQSHDKGKCVGPGGGLQKVTFQPI